MSIISGYRKYGFDAYNEKILKAEHMSNWMDIPMRVDPKGISFEIGAGIEEVEDGFFMLLPTIKELHILSPYCNIIMSDETINLFKKNQVLIRGDFDGNAEAFARKYGLRFLHRDVELAMAGDYTSPGGTDIITLRFKENGHAYIHQDNHCAYGGGENSIDLPEDFYNSMDAMCVADKCWNKYCRELIKANDALRELLEKAKRKGGFFIDYSKELILPNGTLAFYDANAFSFVQGTVNVDFSATQDKFLCNLAPGAKILDFGCGSGRDAKYFLAQGFVVDATDGSSELCKLASEFTGICVRKMLFNELETVSEYDGIWACSSILHCSKQELKDVFTRIVRALKEQGVFYTSFKYGDFEGFCGGRYFTDFTLESFQEFLKSVDGLSLVETWVTPDVRNGRKEEFWLNVLLRKC